MTQAVNCTFCSFDPGKEYAAVAVWRDRRLVRVEMTTLAEVIDARDRNLLSSLCVMERVVTRGQKDNDYSAQDMFDVATAAGEIAGQYLERVYQRPHTVPKKVWQKRVLGALSDSEKSVLPTKKTELYHILDAVGVGLKYLGRI